jgi:hypothetical protein
VRSGQHSETLRGAGVHKRESVQAAHSCLANSGPRGPTPARGDQLRPEGANSGPLDPRSELTRSGRSRPARAEVGPLGPESARV